MAVTMEGVLGGVMVMVMVSSRWCHGNGVMAMVSWQWCHGNGVMAMAMTLDYEATIEGHSNEVLQKWVEAWQWAW